MYSKYLFFYLWFCVFDKKSYFFRLFILLFIKIFSYIKIIMIWQNGDHQNIFIFPTEKIQQKLENGPSSVSNALTVEDSSANNTPTHSRHPSDVPTMGSLQPTPENPAPKASSELFSGFVIGVHRKMVCTFYYNNESLSVFFSVLYRICLCNFCSKDIGKLFFLCCKFTQELTITTLTGTVFY